MSLQIVGAALPRTGTLSLKFALEMLGLGRCYHMSELILDPTPRWRWAFAKLRPGLLDPLWDEFSATLDAPACALWRPLAARFPQSKVILTRRDPERWADSVLATVASPAQIRLMLRSPLAPAALANPPFGLRLDHTSLIRHFEAYGAQVRATIAPARLLEFEAKDGWVPLCEFLDLPVPDMPFPHVNDRETMVRIAQEVGAGKADFAHVQHVTRAFIAEQRQSLLSR